MAEERYVNERMVKIETRVEYIASEQVSLKLLFTKQADMLEGIIRQINSNELTAAAIRERTDQHSKIIERLQTAEVDVSKILESMKAQLNIVKYIGTGLGSLVLGYLFTHFIK